MTSSSMQRTRDSAALARLRRWCLSVSLPWRSGSPVKEASHHLAEVSRLVTLPGDVGYVSIKVSAVTGAQSQGFQEGR